MSAQPSSKRQRRDVERTAAGGCVGAPRGAPAPPGLLSLPDESLRMILAYSLPQEERRVWEWIGMLNQTCSTVRRLALELYPATFKLEDFEDYSRLHPSHNGSRRVDARVNILKVLRSCKSMCANLKQFHVNVDSVLKVNEGEGPSYRKYVADNDIRHNLRALLTTPDLLPLVEWLDICLVSDYIHGYDLIDLRTLSSLPNALPSLRKLCLSKCFSEREYAEPISPNELTQVLMKFRAPLTSLSFIDAWWLTDDHVHAIMPAVGACLTRLELIGCFDGDYAEDLDDLPLTDASLVSIANHAKNLTSFAMVDTSITSSGLERMLSANPSIATLNLSSNRDLDSSTVPVISRCLPRLKMLRGYWLMGSWLNDDTLIALIKAQEEQSESSKISLERIGMMEDYEDGINNLTEAGLGYAMKKGVNVEVCAHHDENLHNELLKLETEVAKVFPSKYVHYVDGSLESRLFVNGEKRKRHKYHG